MHRFIICFVIILLSSAEGNFDAESPPKLQIGQGLLQGTHKKSYDGRIFSAFEGIPYAKPPVGELRFEEPKRATSWRGTLVANKSYICSQPGGTQSITGTEDCLYIYVYVPRKKITERDNFDVVVHIHGGSMIIGSPYDMASPDYLMDKDVVLVTFNYRLGAAGFLSTGDNVVPGNNGLKDQNLALRWIKDNIRYFGGNPDSITLTGFSSGSASVQFHYLSPRSRGLFTRGFSSSSVVTNPGCLTLIPLQKTQILAENLKCSGGNTEKIVKCLKSVPIEKLVNATTVTKLWFKPVVEKPKVGSEPFLPDNPYKMLKEGRVLDVPWVASNVINESLFSLDAVYRNRSMIFSILNNWNDWCRQSLDLVDYVDEDKQERTFSELRRFYIDNSKVTEENGLEKMNRLMTDRHFLVGTDLALRTHVAAVKSPVYFYLFKFVPEDRLEFFGPPAASHGVDNKLMFKFRTNPQRLKPQGDKMMRLFIEFLAQYAKSGIPKIGNTTWIPLNPRQKTLDILEIDSPENIKMKTLKELAPRSFWESLPIKENNHLY